MSDRLFIGAHEVWETCEGNRLVQKEASVRTNRSTEIETRVPPLKHGDPSSFLRAAVQDKSWVACKLMTAEVCCKQNAMHAPPKKDQRVSSV